MTHPLLPAAILCAFACSTAGQTTGGNVELLAGPPATVVMHQSESPNVRGFWEHQDLVLPSPVDVDYDTYGTHVGAPSTPASTLPAGTRVGVFFLYLDGPGMNTFEGDGWIEFDRPILGVIVGTAGLDDTDSLLGNSATAYPTAGTEVFRGYEKGAGYWPDTFQFEERRITIATIRTATAVDSMRILLACSQAASVVSRNGSGVNPTGFVQSAPAIIGSTWSGTVTLAGAPLSVVAHGAGGPTSGVVLSGTVTGEILCLPPYAPIHVAAGAHAFALPDDCGLIGLEVHLQAATLPVGEVRLHNALRITIGDS